LLLPELAERLYGACTQQAARIAIPHDGQRTHPVFALIECALRDSLEDFLTGGDRKILRWMSGHQMITVDFSDAAGSFSNINSEDDLDSATFSIKQRNV
jgi:molybdopterin-guanine dinucleotide biosynthesis protein A